MDDRFQLFKSIVLITSPDQIEQEEWFEHGNYWMIGSGVYKDTYFYIGIPIIKLQNLYYA